MALIEIFHVVADHFPVNSSAEIIEGQWVALNSSGEAVLANGTLRAIGVSGDTKSTDTVGLPTTNASSQGAFQNRVSDSFDETKASGRITVYHSGGKFATNQFENVAYAVGDVLYISTAGNLTTAASANSQVVATVTKTPAAEPSGVPGTDVDGSLSLGSFIEFKMEI